MFALVVSGNQMPFSEALPYECHCEASHFHISHLISFSQQLWWGSVILKHYPYTVLVLYGFWNKLSQT